jgi:hypothetical protein
MWTPSAAAWCLCVRQHALIRPCDRLPLRLRETGRSFVGGVGRVEAVDDGVYHDRLFGDSEGTVCRDRDPVVLRRVSKIAASRRGWTYLAQK